MRTCPWTQLPSLGRAGRLTGAERLRLRLHRCQATNEKDLRSAGPSGSPPDRERRVKDHERGLGDRRDVSREAVPVPRRGRGAPPDPQHDRRAVGEVYLRRNEEGTEGWFRGRSVDLDQGRRPRVVWARSIVRRNLLVPVQLT